MQVFYYKSLAPDGLKFVEKRVDWTLGSRFCESRGRALPTVEDLATDYDKVYMTDAPGDTPHTVDSLEKVFHDFQGDFMPDHVAAQVCAVVDRSHTSMSVGDIIVDHGKVFMVDSMGFILIGEVS